MKKQNGSALMMAIFVISVMGLLGVSMSRILEESSDAVSYEVYSTRAVLAANTGIEVGMVRLFPLGGGLASCLATDTLDLSSYNAYHGCSVSLECSLLVIPGATSNHYHYRISSTAECNAGKFTARRKIEAEARSP